VCSLSLGLIEHRGSDIVNAVGSRPAADPRATSMFGGLYLKGEKQMARKYEYSSVPGRCMFVVVLSTDHVFHSMVATSDWQDAIETARKHAKEGFETSLYKVHGVTDASAARAALEMGEGEPIPIAASAEEIALREKLTANAAWQVVRERFAEHNSLIDASRPGVLKNLETQEIVNTRCDLVESGRGSRKFKERMVKQVLDSQNPEIVDRFQKVVKVLLAQHGLRPR
jgi:hypothetical protein